MTDAELFLVTAQDIQRAQNIVCGAAVKPSEDDWRIYRGSSAYIPNYWNIESHDYTASGFSISGYIHDTDAHIMGAAKTMLAALIRIRDMPGPMIDGPTGAHKFLAHAAVMEIVSEAIALANQSSANPNQQEG